jgi:GNAT superfamily N-acetyltransferase
MAEARVRTAVESDAEAVALLQIAWWRAAYATMLPAAVLGADPSVLARSWGSRIAGHTVLLATEGAEQVGFAAVDPEVASGNGEVLGSIDVLGVLPRWSRRGHGGRLVATAAGLLRNLGATVGSWWIPERDPIVQAFLAGIGWEPDGGRRAWDTGEDTLVEVRYRGSLDLVLL